MCVVLLHVHAYIEFKVSVVCKECPSLNYETVGLFVVPDEVLYEKYSLYIPCSVVMMIMFSKCD